MSSFQDQTVAMLVDTINNLENRSVEYKNELIEVVGDIIKAQKDFEQSIGRSVRPQMTDKIDAFSEICPNLSDN